MALSINTLSAGASPGGRGKAPVIFSYTTADAIATVEGANYFNDAAGMLTTGDVLYANMSDGAKFYRVTNTAGVITLVTEIAFA